MPELVHVQKYVYTLGELDVSARNKAVDILIDQAWETLPSDLIHEMLCDAFCKNAGRDDLLHDAVESMKKLGIRISWSVAYTQSDGVELDGWLRREDLPGFTWPDGIDGIEVTRGRVTSNVYTDEANERINAGVDNYSVGDTKSMDMVNGLQDDLYWHARHTIDDMMKESEVIAHYNAQLFPRRFTEDGRLAPAEFWEKADYVEPVIIKWTEHDVASLLKIMKDSAPDLDTARDILARVARHLTDRSIEAGWQILETLIPQIANESFSNEES